MVIGNIFQYKSYMSSGGIIEQTNRQKRNAEIILMDFKLFQTIYIANMPIYSMRRGNDLGRTYDPTPYGIFD